MIKAGAEFHFAHAAKAFHSDEVTNLYRSLQRKKSEGMADIQIKKLHPDFVNNEAIYYLSQRSISKSVLMKVVQYFPTLSDVVAGFAEGLMNYFEKFKLLALWSRMNYRLHQYWYLRGLLLGSGSSKELYEYIMKNNLVVSENQKLAIDLEKGLKRAEEEIDRLNPLTIDIYYGKKFIGTVSYEPGTEALQGYHLRKILKEKFSTELAAVLFPTQIFTKNN